MTSQNQAEKYAKTLTACLDNAAPKVALPSEFMRELTDDEIAAIAGGQKVRSPSVGRTMTI